MENKETENKETENITIEADNKTKYFFSNYYETEKKNEEKTEEKNEEKKVRKESQTVTEIGPPCNPRSFSIFKSSAGVQFFTSLIEGAGRVTVEVVAGPLLAISEEASDFRCGWVVDEETVKSLR